jgi:cardiolipin synthase
VIAGLVLLFHILGLLGSVHAVMTARTAQGAIAWAVSLNTFPYAAVPAYWVFGRRKFEGHVETFQKQDAQLRQFLNEFQSSLAPYEIAREERVPDYEALKTLARSPLLGSNDVELLIDGEATFDSIIEGIGRARHSVLVEFYIVRDDGLGRRLQQAMMAKAREGVRVLFLYDGIGSYGLTRAYRDELQDAGVEVSPFRTTQGRGNRF